MIVVPPLLLVLKESPKSHSEPAKVLSRIRCGHMVQPVELLDLRYILVPAPYHNIHN